MKKLLAFYSDEKCATDPIAVYHIRAKNDTLSQEEIDKYKVEAEKLGVAAEYHKELDDTQENRELLLGK